MWLFTKYGFFSVVEVTGEPTKIQVRARLRKDIEAIAELAWEATSNRPKIIESKDSDYRFRVVLPRNDWYELGQFLITDIDYSNFKGKVLCPGTEPARSRAYHHVWSTMSYLQDAET